MKRSIRTDYETPRPTHSYFDIFTVTLSVSNGYPFLFDVSCSTHLSLTKIIL